MQELRNERVSKRARLSTPPIKPLEQVNFVRQSFRDKQMALNLAQFASADGDLGLGPDQVDKLVGTLIVSGTPSYRASEMTSAC